MFRFTVKREYINGEFMIYQKQVSYFIICFFLLIASNLVLAQRVYELQDTTPENLILSGVFHPTGNKVLHGTYDAVLKFYNEDASVPTISTDYKIDVHQNYYRFLIALKPVLNQMFIQRKKMFMNIYIKDHVDVTLPFASNPMVIKAGISTTSNQMIDSNVFSVDYTNQRIGIGTVTPTVTLDVVGTVNASQHLYADGQGLFNMTYKGGDNYNSLRSATGEFDLITVNAQGKMMIAGLKDQHVPSLDLQVYGSLLVESNDTVTSNIISGAGSRWMWYADRSVLRIGFTPSIYWDDEFSGSNSIAFGYATRASGLYSIVSGGYYNTVITSNSIIAGGSDNQVLRPDSIILGGAKKSDFKQ